MNNDIRAIVAKALRTGSAAEVDPFLAFEEVPGGHGVVAVTGTPLQPRDEWTLVGTDVTVADLRAATALLKAGLGFLAGLIWGRTLFDASATAWGATPREASEALVTGLREHWHDVTAVATDPVLDGAWALGERRVTAAGVTILAPASEPQDDWRTAAATRRPSADGRRTLELERRHFTGWISVVHGPDWLDELRTAAAVDPRRLAVDLDAAHGRDGRSVPFTWRKPSGYTRVAGAVRAVEPVGDASVA